MPKLKKFCFQHIYSFNEDLFKRNILLSAIDMIKICMKGTSNRVSRYGLNIPNRYRGYRYI